MVVAKCRFVRLVLRARPQLPKPPLMTHEAAYGVPGLLCLLRNFTQESLEEQNLCSASRFRAYPRGFCTADSSKSAPSLSWVFAPGATRGEPLHAPTAAV